MKEDWINYFAEIQLPPRLITNVENKIIEVQSIFGVEIEDVFISNRRTESGVSFLSLWLFTSDKALECKNFVSEDDYDILVVKNKVFYVNIKKTNYTDLENPTGDSNLVCNCYMSNTNLSCSFNALGVNCKYLMNIIKTRYISNVSNI